MSSTDPDVLEPGTALHSCRDVPHGLPGDLPWVPSGHGLGIRPRGARFATTSSLQPSGSSTLHRNVGTVRGAFHLGPLAGGL